MSDELYNRKIKELAALPETRLSEPDASATLDNPLCGDRVTMEARIEKGRPVGIGRAVKGCLLCRAAAALAAGQGENVPSAEAVGRMLRGEPGAAPPEGWEIFTPASAHKSRHDCILLPLKALEKAFKSK